MLPSPPAWAIRGKIVKGFQRGGTQLGFPTANVKLDEACISNLSKFLNTVWCGFCVIEGNTIVPGKEHLYDEATPCTSFDVKSQNGSGSVTRIYPTVLSVGTNPHFKNVALTVEPYIMYKFDEDFYGRTLRVVAVKQLRQMGAFISLNALIAEIKNDCVLGGKILISEDVGLPLRFAVMDPTNFNLKRFPTVVDDDNDDDDDNSVKPSFRFLGNQGMNNAHV